MTGLGNIDDVYNHYLKVIDENAKLKEQLEIAIKALEVYVERNHWDKKGVSFGKYTKGWVLANKALKQIAKIKELDK